MSYLTDLLRYFSAHWFLF